MPAAIQIFPNSKEQNAVFSIIIPSWNNLSYLKQCVESIRKNSTYSHQLIIHVNEGTDGTLEWVEKLGIDYSWCIRNSGICFPVNACRSLVKTDYIVLMSDDMYVCPEWDKHLMEEVMRHDTQLFFLSSTLIEPRVNGNVNALAPFYYGLSPDTFEETKLLSEYMNPRRDDWNGAYSVPCLIHRSTWDLVGGYSVELMPGFCADFDLAMKLYRAGVRSFKGVGKSRIYHFIAKPLIKLKKNDGHSQFLSKWGITTGVFHREYLKHGTPYRALPQFMEGKRIHRIRRWSKLLIAWSLLK